MYRTDADIIKSMQQPHDMDGSIQVILHFVAPYDYCRTGKKEDVRDLIGWSTGFSNR